LAISDADPCQEPSGSLTAAFSKRYTVLLNRQRNATSIATHTTPVNRVHIQVAHYLHYIAHEALQSRVNLSLGRLPHPPGDRPLDAVIMDERRHGPRWLCDDDYY